MALMAFFALARGDLSFTPIVIIFVSIETDPSTRKIMFFETDPIPIPAEYLCICV